jgi:hypothetical protein
MGPAPRLAGVVLLLVCLAGMTVHYGAVADDRSPYPTEKDLAAHYDRYVGEEVYFWARVTEVRSDSLVVRNGAVRLTVVGASPTAVAGDYVQVAGRLRPEQVVAADRVVVSAASRRPFLLGVSLVGAAVVLVAFLRSWTVDTDRWGFVPREKP